LITLPHPEQKKNPKRIKMNKTKIVEDGKEITKLKHQRITKMFVICSNFFNLNKPDLFYRVGVG
jgi:hypothetical protein